MEEKTITIPVEEYKKLLEASVRIDLFANFVNSTTYVISRDECGKYLGFEVVNMKD